MVSQTQLSQIRHHNTLIALLCAPFNEQLSAQQISDAYVLLLLFSLLLGPWRVIH